MYILLRSLLTPDPQFFILTAPLSLAVHAKKKGIGTHLMVNLDYIIDVVVNPILS